MPIEEDLKKRLTDAMRAKDRRTSDVIRMINTKVMERRTAADFKGVVDDALFLDVIAAYMKSLQKAKEQFDAAGDRGKEQSAELAWEIAFLDALLPKKELPADVAEAVAAAVAAAGAPDPKLVGRLVGEVMKKFKGQVDAADVRRAVEAALAAKT